MKIISVLVNSLLISFFFKYFTKIEVSSYENYVKPIIRICSFSTNYRTLKMFFESRYVVY